MFPLKNPKNKQTTTTTKKTPHTTKHNIYFKAVEEIHRIQRSYLPSDCRHTPKASHHQHRAVEIKGNIFKDIAMMMRLMIGGIGRQVRSPLSTTALPGSPASVAPQAISACPCLSRSTTSSLSGPTPFHSSFALLRTWLGSDMCDVNFSYQRISEDE